MRNYTNGKITFPRDEGFKGTPFDWWYITFHFITESKKLFSYTLVYLHKEGLCNRQTSITDEETKLFFWEMKKGEFTVKRDLLDLIYWNKNGDRDYWRQKDGLLFSYDLFTETSNRFKLNVTLTANKPPVVHGDGGIVTMGDGGKSYYYSFTDLAVNGTFTFDGVTERISGVAWIDRQWGSWDISGFDGWEWFALQLNDNTEIMLYLIFDREKESRLCQSLTVVFKDGTFVNIDDPDQFELKNLGYWKVNYKKLPLFVQKYFLKSYLSSGWRLTIPLYDFDLYIFPIVKNQRIGYGTWEGSCRIIGRHNGAKINCVSTVELTHIYVYPIQVKLIKNLLHRFTLPISKPLRKIFSY
ncbi:MAG: lipocalin-like domain-containing protein [Candidatus Bathyarchaeia archaeon]|jgi:predicted secreted hydrolase